MKTALFALHFACQWAVFVLLWRYVVRPEEDWIIRAFAAGCWLWVAVVGVIVGIWIKNTF